MSQICDRARGIPYRARSVGPPSPEIPLGEVKQEEWGERQRPVVHQGREVSRPVSRVTDHRWKGLLLPPPGIRPQEDLHSNGSTKLHNGTASYAGRRRPGGGKNDSLGPNSKVGETHRHDEGNALGETAPPKIQPRLRQLQDATVCKKSPSSASTVKSLDTWPGRVGRKARRAVIAQAATLQANAKGIWQFP